MWLKRKYEPCLIEGLYLCTINSPSLQALTFCNYHSILFLCSQLFQILHLKDNISLPFCVWVFLFSDSIYVIMNDNLFLFKDRIAFYCVFLHHISFTCSLADDCLVDFRTWLLWTILQGPWECSCVFNTLLLIPLDLCPEVDLMVIPFLRHLHTIFRNDCNNLSPILVTFLLLW